MRCIKTGGQAYLSEQAYLNEYGEYVYGDFYITRNGTLVGRICERSRKSISPKLHLTIMSLENWFDDLDTGVDGRSSTLISGDWVDHGYEGKSLDA